MVFVALSYKSNTEKDAELNPIDDDSRLVSMEDSKTENKDVEFYNITGLKLFVLTVCTWGLYPAYYFYRNWVALKKQADVDCSPFWRGLFGLPFITSLIFNPVLFKHIFKRAKKHNYPYPNALSANRTAIIFAIISFLGSLSPLLILGMFVPLRTVQEAIEFNNNAIDKKAKPDGHFSYIEIGAICVGVLVWGLYLLYR